jgi:predicted transcriptional regulator
MFGSDNDAFPGAFRRGARGTIDIVADILSICRTAKKRTGVMYQANLSHQMLQFYLWHMVDLGLVEESVDSSFKTTQRGEEFLAYYHRLATILQGLGSGAASPRAAVPRSVSSYHFRKMK